MAIRAGFWDPAASDAYRSANRFSAARISADASVWAMARRSGTISMSSACVTYDMAPIYAPGSTVRSDPGHAAAQNMARPAFVTNYSATWTRLAAASTGGSPPAEQL